MILQIRDLRCVFPGTDGPVYAVNGVNLTINKGEVHALIGESGCGKSVTARAVLGLETDARLPESPLVSGEALFGGRNLLELSVKDLREVRGKNIAMIFQNPGNSLSPLERAGAQIEEALTNHIPLSKDEKKRRVQELLKSVGLGEEVARMYPFELSGGMQQRVMIAQAVSCSPSLLIADEATTALDVTIQKQILTLLRSLCKELSMAILFITHNFALVSEIADRVSVMYAGQIVESAATGELLSNPVHPYTKGLIACIPRRGLKPLPVIAGFPPRLREPPYLCPFAPRCAFALPQCRNEPPVQRKINSEHKVLCLLRS